MMALSLAEIAKKLYGTPYDRDMLISACLLHDVTKVLESEPDPQCIPTGDSVLPARKSEIGKALPHAAYAAHMILEKGLPISLFDKVLLSMDGSIWGLFFTCQGIFCIEKQGLAMRLGQGGGAAAALLRNQLTFWLSHPSRRHF